MILFYFIYLFYFINIILYCYIIFLYLYQKRIFIKYIFIQNESEILFSIQNVFNYYVCVRNMCTCVVSIVQLSEVREMELLIDPCNMSLTRREYLVVILVPVTWTYWSVLGMLEHATRTNLIDITKKRNRCPNFWLIPSCFLRIDF